MLYNATVGRSLPVTPHETAIHEFDQNVDSVKRPGSPTCLRQLRPVKQLEVAAAGALVAVAATPPGPQTNRHADKHRHPHYWHRHAWCFLTGEVDRGPCRLRALVLGEVRIRTSIELHRVAAITITLHGRKVCFA